MKSPSWQNITIAQYQKVYQVTNDKDLDDLEKTIKLISIMYEISEDNVQELPVDKFNKLAKSITFLNYRMR